MNNPDFDIAIWEQLRKKWAQLDESGKSVRVDFQLIHTDAEKDKTLAIDVIQTIDEEIVVETVQRNAGEAHETLGISGLSTEELVQAYKKMLHELYRRSGAEDTDLIVEMTPHAATAGESTGYLQQAGSDLKKSVPLNYQHYYVLNTLREKMIGLPRDHWSRVKAIYHAGDVEFYFDFQDN
jgi:hypothetical protein